MLTRLFVTGTDTNVGKTVVTRALLQSLNRSGSTAVGFKPIATESHETVEGERNRDAQIIHNSSPVEVRYDEINPILLENCYLSKNEIDFDQISNELNKLSQKAECVVIEGNGGWRYLLDDTTFYSEWVVKEQIPVVLVVGIQPGCVNHSILTAQSIANDGLKLVGWVANRINPGLPYYAKIVERLSQHIQAPLIGEIPYLLRPEERDLSCYLDLSQLEIAQPA
ncbi:dethiobiotin synthase [Proteus hauseri]|uniref:dethiobiotin synthase n=1 Tax=Proteus hauseri TaxID=183417 RepID=UPI0032D9FF71